MGRRTRPAVGCLSVTVLAAALGLLLSAEAAAAGVSDAVSGSAADHTCAVTSMSEIFCWGRNDWGQLGDGTVVDSPDPVLAARGTLVATGHDHTCAVSEGSVTCWGRNTSGQLGDGGDPGLKDVAGVAAGYAHSCAVDLAGDVWCWGNNYHGQLGAPPVEARRPTPSLARLLVDAMEVTAGDWHTCAITTGGALYCWGENTYGQLGNGLTGQNAVVTPQQVFSTGVDQVALGERHSCARLGGSVYCWGNGSGNPALVALEEEAIDIAAGGQHACAVLLSGVLDCWGVGRAGQLGDRSLADVVSVTAGRRHTCAIAMGGLLFCWGSNEAGQLGGDGGGGPAPVEVALEKSKPEAVGGFAEPPVLGTPGSVEAPPLTVVVVVWLLVAGLFLATRRRTS